MIVCLPLWWETAAQAKGHSYLKAAGVEWEGGKEGVSGLW